LRTQRRLQEDKLVTSIKAAHLQGRGVYRSKRIQGALIEQGFQVSLNRIRRLRRLHGIGCSHKKKSLDKQMTKHLVVDALRAAYRRKKPPRCLIHYSDRGSQYCSAAYRALQDSYGMVTYMSRKGNCWDKAPMESFFGSIKTESLHHYRFSSREEAKLVVFEYIEVLYSRIRRHSKINNTAPATYAAQFQSTLQ
jgi:transposase InsO family protein